MTKDAVRNEYAMMMMMTMLMIPNTTKGDKRQESKIRAERTRPAIIDEGCFALQ